ncbi:hypothetical protein BKA00_006334 [Actinomadura coerulea]|uniref:DUF4132 domain-containing protein n=1 Tax=Actinomadura coerulea TaxID=46159 RepID=A0A7X0L2B8_9ACTN|nr:hypothetical protein [Actinomadura coerulea]MBB6399420.1 hypothetical protein [Actinomadura coerulea]GGQ28768.1 hypothetical protein GCM10010187_51930 [Actinomadura coerulea]
MTRFPQPPAPADLAAAGPRGAKRMLTKAADPLPAADLAPFFEQACRELARAGESELAFWAFGQARKVEKDHPALLDLDRVQKVFLELVPAGGVGPAALRDYAKTLAAELPGEEAHARFREVVCAAFDAGVVPYARIFPDLRMLARGAKIKKRDEEEFLAERLLRAGLVPVASHQVWAAARAPLAAVAERDADLMKLLVAAEPDRARHEEESGEEVAEEIRQMWLESLAESGAGAHLPAQWFGTAGRGCAAAVLLRLADQAGDRLFPDAEVVYGEETDPAVPPPDHRHIIPRGRMGTDSPNWWGSGFDAKQHAADVASGPEGRERFAGLLDAFVRDLGYYGNVDYPATVRELWDLPETREVLREAVDGWKADAGRPDLPFLHDALHRLVRLTGRGGYLDLEPDAAEDLEPADPVDALLAALRGGVPAEFAVPGDATPSKSPKAGRTIIQHLGHLTIAERGWHAHASVAGEDGPALRLPQLPDGMLPWYDGKTGVVSRIKDGVWQTFRVEGQTGESVALTLDPGTATARPEAPGTAEVTFPGAAGPSEVRLSRGAITVTAPDGTRTARLLFSPVMSSKSSLVPPPGWWPRRDPADPDGSAALRRLDRGGAARLLEAALTGPRAAAEALEAVLPEVTAPALRDGVLEAARTAAQCLLLAIESRDRTGRLQPPALPALVSPAAGLPFRRTAAQTRWLVRQRLLARALESAATGEPAAGEPYLVRTVSLPPRASVGADLDTLAGFALPAVLPWTSDSDRESVLDVLRLWANAPIGDGAGACRKLRLTPAGGEEQSNAERQMVDRRLEEEAPGELWRTPDGALLILDYQRRDRIATAVEYAPGGTFGPTTPPGWRAARPPAPCWGGADRIVRLLRLLDDRGPAPIDASATVRLLAERAGFGLADAVAVCKFPAEVLDADIPMAGATLPFPMRDAVRERLLPDDPAALWTGGLAVEAATGWWRAHGETRPSKP